MGGIFINYRTTPATTAVALVLRERLREIFGVGNVYLDRESIDAGAAYPDDLRRGLDRSQVVLALVHEDWLADLDAKTGKDWVRWELETALARGKLVIPVLVDDAVLPHEGRLSGGLRKFALAQARRVRSSDPRADADALAEELTLLVDTGFAQAHAERTGTSAPDARAWLAAVGALAGLGGLLLPVDATLVGTLLLVSLAVALVSVVVLLGRKRIRAAESLLQPMTPTEYYTRVGVPFVLGFLGLCAAEVFADGVEPVGVLVMAGIVLFAVIHMTLSLRRDRLRHEERERLWPRRLSTPVAPVALRQDLARLERHLAGHEGHDRRLPLTSRLRCRKALLGLTLGVRLLRRDSRRRRVVWALADHPVWTAVCVAWTVGVVTASRFAPVTAVLVGGAAALVGEAAFRRQRWTRDAVADEVEAHVTALRERWRTIDHRRD
ncbi:hypothetical protein GCM10022243_61770 [Saccharothrix violaceirubra]|uniref:TIR domain-containing protein n=1 Tax=Saccharothrix violaceirubra TaxID=413306 RepID=A0A7W7T7T3_9PSEU|nr:toll/interleukin-1 receptor domain-containing protein [Saccharothrix violaceirubra]MBB4968153.1 hypothetical protein [Saccharothrix violaceirubra]